MADQIIDLTAPPPEEHITPERPISPQPRADDENRRSRRKRRKRESVVRGDRPQTGNHSLEEGELDGNFTQERERHHSGEHDNLKRKRRGPKDHSRSPTPPRSPTDTAPLFFVDVEPMPIPAAHNLDPSIAPDELGDKLLLPAHVSIFGLAPVEILPTSNADLDYEDYIEYLDYDDRKDFVRYFEENIDGSAKKVNRTVCKNCGAEGEHKTAACPVLICLTCGARNEHLTRSCPIGKTCFTCGMKGHINATCPNRNSARMSDFTRYDDCSRCGSTLHNTKECPTLWRLYQYQADGEQIHTLGQGGEGYIATDEWCYNCGCCGHWGDDCQDIPHRGDFPGEPSAFSTHNTLSGPFFDAELPRSTSHRREPREWEHHDPSDSWGKDLPENVGRKGRRKNAEKMEKRAQEQEANDDPDDWFGNPRHSRSRGLRQENEKRPPTGPSKKMSFGKSIQQAGRQFQTPSLADRLGEPLHQNNHRRPAKSRSSNSRSDHDHNRKYHSKRDDNFREGYRRRDESGPRYQGGYSR